MDYLPTICGSKQKTSHPNKQDYIETEIKFKNQISLTPRNISARTLNQDCGLIKQCYSVIEEQQNYIEKIQRDNQRKDIIISNLLAKTPKYQNSKQTMAINETMGYKIEQLSHRVQYLTNQNECYQLEIENRNGQIRELVMSIKKCQAKQLQLLGIIEENKENAQKLKCAYEAKISKLVSGIKSKVQNDMLKMKQREQTETKQEQLSVSHQKHTNFQQTFMYVNTTPVRDQNQRSSLKSNSTSANFSSSTKPYRCQGSILKNIFKREENPQMVSQVTHHICKNDFIYSQCKSFPNTHRYQNSPIKTQQNGAKQQKQLNQMLKAVKDVQFISDSYDEDTYTSQESYEDNSNYESSIDQQNKRTGQRISINKIIEQFAEYNDGIANPVNCSEVSYKNILKNRKVGDHKINHILEQLSKKIKRFQQSEEEL